MTYIIGKTKLTVEESAGRVRLISRVHSLTHMMLRQARAMVDAAIEDDLRIHHGSLTLMRALLTETFDDPIVHVKSFFTVDIHLVTFGHTE
jgi:hypothetical protein